MPEFMAANHDDLTELARTSKLAFDHDVNYGAPAPDGPPGYDSAAWHARAAGWGARLYKIVEDGTIIGGIIVHPDGPHGKPGHWVLGRIWLVPEWQNRGIGENAMAFAEGTVPDVRVWKLDTPEWNLRTQHFYEKLGYVRVGSDNGLVLYEKSVGHSG